MVTAHISCMFYSYFIHSTFLPQSDSGRTVSPGLPWPSTFINQLAAEVLSALACQIETLLWLARGTPSLSLGKHRVRLISCFKPLPAEPSPGQAMRGRQSGNRKERARGTAIHHFAGPWSPPCHSTHTHQ